MATRMFAVSEAKGWVEIRGGKSPPRKVVTRASKMVDRTVYVPPRFMEMTANGLVFTGAGHKKVKEKVTIIHTAWVGGRTLCVLSTEKFARWFSVGVRKGGCVELLPAQVEEVRQELARERKDGKQNEAGPLAMPQDGIADDEAED